MTVTVNGQPEPLPSPSTLEALLRRLDPHHPFVVARNGDVVPRHRYAECELCPGDEIEVVHPAAGG
jgi:thiamine biosynthesis protein ThiS